MSRNQLDFLTFTHFLVAAPWEDSFIDLPGAQLPSRGISQTAEWLIFLTHTNMSTHNNYAVEKPFSSLVACT